MPAIGVDTLAHSSYFAVVGLFSLFLTLEVGSSHSLVAVAASGSFVQKCLFMNL